MSGIDSDLIRGHIDTIILKTLFDGDKYGYEILDEVAKKSDGAYELKQPTLYSCLKRLENQGLISSYWVDSEIGGKRHYYCLTEQGKETYIENQKNWLRSRQIIDNLIWEDAPVIPKHEVVTEKQENQDNEIISDVPSVVDYIPPTSSLENFDYEANTIDNPEESSNDNTVDLINDSNETVEDLISNLNNDDEINEITKENINNSQDINEYDNTVSTINENQISETTEESTDIMALLGHYDSTYSVENEIEKLNAASEDLDSINDEYSSNSFLENFVKNYMSSDEAEINSLDESKFNNTEEIVDDFNLNLSSYLNLDDSYFSSNQQKDKINFITPNVVIDNLESKQSEYNENTDVQSDAHIEFIDDLNDEIYTNEINNDNDDNSTPTYVSFGEEIVRNHEEDNTAYSYIEDNTEEATNEEITNLNFDNSEDIYRPEYETYSTPLFENDVNTEKSIFQETSFEEITTEKNNPIFTESESQESTLGYDILPAKYTDDVSKRKLAELSTFAKESSVTEEETTREEILFDTNDFLERNKVTKNYDKLISEFEKEGLSVRIHKKLVKENKDSRTYVETNKIKMTRNWISFCFIAAILAITFAIMYNNGSTYYGFSYKYFIIGLTVAMLVPIISTIIYALNPYKKNIANFSIGLSFMLSGLVFIQLLLIIYCVNLQLGFYSFSQEHYNHLYWIIPGILSLYPILNSIIYTSLFKSKNFHS